MKSNLFFALEEPEDHSGNAANSRNSSEKGVNVLSQNVKKPSEFVQANKAKNKTKCSDNVTRERFGLVSHVKSSFCIEKSMGNKVHVNY